VSEWTNQRLAVVLHRADFIDFCVAPLNVLLSCLTTVNDRRFSVIWRFVRSFFQWANNNFCRSTDCNKRVAS